MFYANLEGELPLGDLENKKYFHATKAVSCMYHILYLLLIAVHLFFCVAAQCSLLNEVRLLVGITTMTFSIACNSHS